MGENVRCQRVLDVMQYGKARVYTDSLGKVYATRKMTNRWETCFELLHWVKGQWGFLGAGAHGGKKGLHHFVAGDPATLVLEPHFSPLPLPIKYKPWNDL